MIREMLEPRVFGGSVPMLGLGGNGDDGAGCHLNGFLAPFLIPAATSHADEHLHLLVVNMPVVAAAGLEVDVHHTSANVGQVTLTNEILSVGIGLALGPFGEQRVALVAEPSAELIHELLTVAHVDGTLLVGGQLRGNTFQAAQGSHGHYLAVGSRKLIASEDVTKEVRLQVVVVLRTEIVVERTA